LLIMYDAPPRPGANAAADDTTTMSFDHFVDGRTNGVEHSGEVDVDDPVESGGVDSAESARWRCHTGVRDDDVEPPGLFDHVLHGCVHAGPVADVGHESQDPFLSQCAVGGGEGRRIVIDHCDGCAAGVQRARRGQSDAVPPAGDQDDLAGDVVLSPFSG
jgi:hypothetical protein